MEKCYFRVQQKQVIFLKNMKNIEIKVRINNRSRILDILRDLNARKAGILTQVDTYYRTMQGRLKIREERETKTITLIFYFRPDKPNSRISEYQIVQLPKQCASHSKIILAQAFGKSVVVKKKRTLYMYKHTRIHLDRVEKLGNFLELETVIGKQLKSAAQREHAKVIQKLALGTYKHIPVSYSDLL